MARRDLLLTPPLCLRSRLKEPPALGASLPAPSPSLKPSAAKRPHILSFMAATAAVWPRFASKPAAVGVAMLQTFCACLLGPRSAPRLQPCSRHIHRRSGLLSAAVSLASAAILCAPSPGLSNFDGPAPCCLHAPPSPPACREGCRM